MLTNNNMQTQLLVLVASGDQCSDASVGQHHKQSEAQQVHMLPHSKLTVYDSPVCYARHCVMAQQSVQSPV